MAPPGGLSRDRPAESRIRAPARALRRAAAPLFSDLRPSRPAKSPGMTKKPAGSARKGIDDAATMLYQWKSRKHLRSAGAADRDRDHPPNAALPGTDRTRPDLR